MKFQNSAGQLRSLIHQLLATALDVFRPEMAWADPGPLPSPSPPTQTGGISGQSVSPGYVSPGNTLSAPGETVSINRLIRKLSRIADDIKAITGSLKGAVGTEKGKADLKKTLDNLAALTEIQAHRSAL